MTRKTLLCILALMAASVLSAAPDKPRTVIHVVTIKWKADATAAQIQKATKALETMNYPGLLHVWTRPIKMQLDEGYKQIFVMEFESKEALDKYSNSPAQKGWYEVYLPIREESRTHDITN